MFLSYAVHYPQPDKVAQLAQRMRDCGDVIKTQPGIIVVDAFRDATNGTLLALALWEQDSMDIAGAATRRGPIVWLTVWVRVRDLDGAAAQAAALESESDWP